MRDGIAKTRYGIPGRLGSALLVGAAALALPSCSFRSESGSQLLQINLPKTSNATRDALSGLALPFSPVRAGRDQATPESLGDFNCFLVNITGSDIPVNSNVHCSNPADFAGIAVGLVPASSSSISVEVPNGPQRQIQLVGFDSTAGCPDLSTLFASSGNPGQGIGSPYLLGQTTVDILGDVTVDLNATFNPASPTPAFQSCGVGGQGPLYPPTVAYGGSFSSNSDGPISVFPATDAPSSAAGAPELSGIPLPGVATLPFQSNGNHSTPLTVPTQISSTAGTSNQRAVIQLQWDVSGMDFVTYPYGSFNLDVRGGQADDCWDSLLYNVSAAVYDSVDGEWIALGSGNSSNNDQWISASTSVNVPLQKLVLTKSDGHRYILVDVESDYGGDSTADCTSGVYVADASLQVAKNWGATNGGGGSLNLGSTALPSSVAGNDFTVAEDQSYLLIPQNGTPPYTYSIANAGSGNPVLSPMTGIYTAGSTAGADTVCVTDSSATATPTCVTMNALPSNTILGLTLIPVSPAERNSDGTWPAGDTVTYNLQTVGFDGGAPPSATGSAIAVSLITPTTITASTGINITLDSNTASAPVTLESTYAGTQIVSAYTTGDEGGDGEPLAQNGISLAFRVSPGTASGVGLFPASVVTPAAIQWQLAATPTSYVTGNECAPYSLQTTDSYGNPVSTPAGASITIEALSPNMLYSDSGCESQLMTPFLMTASNIPVYIKTPDTYDFDEYATISGSGNAFGIVDADPSTYPVSFELALDPSTTGPDSNSCVAIDLLAVDSSGALQMASTTLTASIVGQDPWVMPPVYTSQSNCDSSISSASSVSVSASSSSKEFWVQAGNGDTSTLQAIPQTGTSLNPSAPFALSF